MPRQITFDEYTRIRTLFFDGGLSKPAISRQTGCSLDQVKRAVRNSEYCHRPGRPPSFTKEEEQQLINFISASTTNRRMSYIQLSEALFDKKHGPYAIRSTLWRLGYRRYVALVRPPLSDKNRQRRLQFALEYKDWTLEQWKAVLWSDETWVLRQKSHKTFITRRADEQLDKYCILEKESRPGGWMFWGCISGHGGKGPGVFWEKEWGSISAESYSARILPIVEGWLTLLRRQHGDVNFLFIQDNAPGHAARKTNEEIQQRRIPTMSWPPYSPDLNPIEKCWLWLKRRVDKRFDEYRKKPSYNTLRMWVKEAWEEMPNEFVESLIASLPEKMQAVIDAEGGYIHEK